MTIEWEQLVYGKLVQSADGPIVPRLDYRVTGASAGYPDDLVASSHPNRIGLNTDDLFSWQEYPWNSVGGGFIVRGVADQRQPRIIAGRIRGRPEKGEGQAGRLYVQAHYAVTTVDQWDPSALALLPDFLHADPMTAENRALPPLRLDGVAISRWLHQPLHAGWLDEIAAPLAAVMSGIPFSLQDWHAKIGPFLERCALCACAVPRTLVWRLSVGAGLAKMKGDVSLGLGQIAPAVGLRVIGTTVYGGDAPQLERGRKYVEWLRQHASSVGTRSELVARVAELLPQFAEPFAVQPQVDAGDAARQIAENVAEQVQLSALDAWLLGGPGPKPDTSFRLFQKEALLGLLRNLRPRGLELLPEFLTTSTFETLLQVAEEDTGIGRLAGMTARLAGHSAEVARVEDVEDLASDNLPAGLVALIKENLTRALALGRLDAKWSRQVRDQFRQIPWLEAWFVERREDWLWLAIGLVAKHRDGDLLTAVRGPGNPAVDAFEVLISPGQSISAYESAAKNLVESAVRRHQTENLDGLFAYLVENGRLLAAVGLAGSCRSRGLRLDAAQVLTEPKPTDDERRVAFAQALVDELEISSQTPKGEITLGLLVATSRLPDMNGSTSMALARQLGNPCAEILLGIRDSGLPEQFSEQSEEIAQHAFQNNPRLVDRLWSMLCGSDEKSVSAQRPLLRLMSDIRLLSAPLSPTPKFVAHLFQSRPCEFPDIEWSKAESAAVRRLLRDRRGLLVDSLVTARSLRQLINGLSVIERIAPVLPRRKELIEELIRLRLVRDGRLDRLLERLVDWRWHRAPVWRLLFLPWNELYADQENTFPEGAGRAGGWSNPELSPVSGRKSAIDPSSDEAELAAGLPYRQYLALAALGVSVSPGPIFFEGLPAFGSEAKKLHLDGLTRLARFAHGADADDYTCVVVDILLARVGRSEAREQLMAHLARGGLGRFATKLIGGDMPPAVGAVLDALRLLSEERRAQKEFRILNPDSMG